HHLQDLQPRFLRLIEGVGEYLGRNTVDLRVELQRGDRVGGAGELEVHVAEGVLGAEDVGQGDVIVAVLDQTHGDSGDGALDRYTGVHQRQAGRTDGGHRRRTVRRQDLADEPQRVGELLVARDDRQHRPARERAVADLATLGRA